MTNDLSQCGNCIYHYTYNGQNMCKQVGDDFYLQWKVENCPYHTTITRATAISDEIYRLRAENAELHERLERSIELPFFQEDGEARILVYRDKNGIVCTELYFEDEIYWGRHGDEAAEARLAELKGEKE